MTSFDIDSSSTVSKDFQQVMSPNGLNQTTSTTCSSGMTDWDDVDHPKSTGFGVSAFADDVAVQRHGVSSRSRNGSGLKKEGFQRANIDV